MPDKRLTIGFARRGYSATGGAEAYLRRLARGVVDLGHDVRLITTTDWPGSAWPFGEITRVRARSTIGFANALEEFRPQSGCDVLMSLERVWHCDVYRAGDGVHRAWLERRKQFGTSLQRLSHFLNRKHGDIVRPPDRPAPPASSEEHVKATPRRPGKPALPDFRPTASAISRTSPYSRAPASGVTTM